jgi:phosphoglycerol transferase MdoB-like AlkP superfamily enzyme
LIVSPVTAARVINADFSRIAGKVCRPDSFAMLKHMLNKTRYYLSVAYQDTVFKVFVVLLLLKTSLFCVLTSLGINSFTTSLGAVLVVMSFSLLSNNVFFKVSYLFMVDFVFSVIYAAQSVYFKYFNDFITIYNINEYKQISAVYESVTHITGYEVLFFIDILILPLLSRRISSNKNVSSDRYKSFFLIFLTGIYLNLNYVMQREFTSQFFSRYVFVNNFGIATYHVHDAITFFFEKYRNKEITDSELRYINTQLKEHSAGRGKNDFSAIGIGRNLILIQVESLQNFVIGRKYLGKEITPNLNRLLAHGILFRNVYDQTAAGNSSDAMFLANCSLYPAARGTVAFLHGQNHFDSLAGLLGENGYETMVLHAYYRNFWNFATLDRSLGFRHQKYEEEFAKNEIIGWGVSDRSFFAQSVGKIKELPRPFYVLMRTLTAHDPFDSVTPAIGNFPTEGLENKIIGGYIRSMHYVDASIGEFLHGLSDAGLLSSTVIVVYGDHRARLPEDELRTICVLNKDERMKVALIVSSPGWQTRAFVDTVGGLVDLAPTISNILGISTLGKVFLGNDMGRKSAGYVIFRDGSCISPDGLVDRQSALKELRTSDLLVEKDAVSLVKKFHSSAASR